MPVEEVPSFLILPFLKDFSLYAFHFKSLSSLKLSQGFHSFPLGNGELDESSLSVLREGRSLNGITEI